MSAQNNRPEDIKVIAGIQVDFPDLGVMIKGGTVLRDRRFIIKSPLPPTALFPKKEDEYDSFTPRRIVIDFELVDNASVVVTEDLELIIYITQEDIDFADGDFLNIKINKWVNEEWKWLEITERMFIAPPIRSKFGERFVGYCKVKYTAQDDPPIAVGK